MRPWRIGTRSGTRVVFCSSRIPTGSRRPSKAAHSRCASSGTVSRSARPSAIRVATAFGRSSTPRWCFLPLAGFARLFEVTPAFAICLYLQPLRGGLDRPLSHGIAHRAAQCEIEHGMLGAIRQLVEHERLADAGIPAIHRLLTARRLKKVI